MNKKRITKATEPTVDETSLSWKIFSAFVTNSQICVTEKELQEYTINELNISKEMMPDGFLEHLPAILTTFMNLWSGWHFKGDFLAGKFQKEHYYHRFKKFMCHKMNIIVRGQFAAAKKAVMEQPSQIGKTGKTSDTTFSPYAISITCPAPMLNTIAFSNSGEDVIMKQHLGTRWLDLSNAQLVNWPHIEVTFQSDDLYFVRRQATDFLRYLNFLPHDAHKQTTKIVEDIQSYGTQECYSIDFLEKYIKVYLASLQKLPEISQLRMMEIQTLLLHFLEDIKIININKSIATNTSVLFRLSHALFIRNKKLVKSLDKADDEARVGYCEIITPKVQLLLIYFKAKQKNTPELAFEYTDKLNKSSQRNRISVVPMISYTCTFCKTKYEGDDSKQQILQHMKFNHKMEQHVRCTLCKKQFEVQNLAACRWRHQCLPSFSSN